MIKEATKTLLILTGSVLAISAAIYSLMIYPQKAHIETLSQDITQLVRMVESATAEQRQLLSLEHKVKQYEDSLAFLERRIYERKRLPEVLRTFLEIGHKYNLQFSGIYPKFDDLLENKGGGPGNPLIFMPVEIVFNGKFRRVGQYIEQLDKQDFLFSLNRVDMAMNPESYPNINVVVRGTVHMRQSEMAPISATKM